MDNQNPKIQPMMTPGGIKKVSPEREKLTDSEDEEDEGRV